MRPLPPSSPVDIRRTDDRGIPPYQVTLQLHMCTHNVYLSHPAIRPFFTYLTYPTAAARRVWVSSGYFGVKSAGVAI